MPRVLALLPAAGGQARPVMVVEYVVGVPLSEVLDGPADASLEELGVEVGRVVAGIGMVTFERPGFFAGLDLAVGPMPPWSEQLPRLVAEWLGKVPVERLGPAASTAWLELCTAHAPVLTRIDDQARLAHGDINPKNILVAHDGSGWRVTSVLDWEFTYSGCPYGDAANMLRFDAEYPPAFGAGFRTGFATHQPTPPSRLASPGPRPRHVRPHRSPHPPQRPPDRRPSRHPDPPLARARRTDLTSGLRALRWAQTLSTGLRPEAQAARRTTVSQSCARPRRHAWWPGQTLFTKRSPALKASVLKSSPMPCRRSVT